MTPLRQIQEAVHSRTRQIAESHPSWPCRQGCDDCCRRLASPPLVTHDEWRWIAAALDALPAAVADPARRRIRDSASAVAPVVCPLLDAAAASCLVYQARPVACRAYGFYAEREGVLGCPRIESISRQFPDVVWGNHTALEERLRPLGPAAPLSRWLARAELHWGSQCKSP